MRRRNYQVTLDEASPGMVLSDDLLDAKGKTLLPAHTELSQDIIKSLRKRDVETIPILGEEISESDHVADEQRHGRRLERLFRKHTPDDMATEILKQFVTTFRLGVQP
jgi:hypothetical protein